VGDLDVEVLEQPDSRVAACVGVGAVARQLDEVVRVGDPHRAGEVGEEDHARLQRRDEERLAPRVVAGDLAAELADACGQLLPRQVDLADGARL
jgi:hypothetical protein